MVKKRLVFTSLLAVCLTAGFAQAEMYGFQGVTLNDPTNTAVGESQLFMDVSPLAVQAGKLQVLFRFSNTGPSASSITQIYLDDEAGVIDSLVSLIDKDEGVGGDAGVDFSLGNVSPPNLPGGKSIAPKFNATADLSTGADSPVAPNGVGAAENLGLIVGLKSGLDFGDLIGSLALGGEGLRVGLHVQSFANGGSESFVNNAEAVPVPGAVLLGLLGLGAVGYLKRRMA